MIMNIFFFGKPPKIKNAIYTQYYSTAKFMMRLELAIVYNSHIQTLLEVCLHKFCWSFGCLVENKDLNITLVIINLTVKVINYLFVMLHLSSIKILRARELNM